MCRFTLICQQVQHKSSIHLAWYQSLLVTKRNLLILRIYGYLTPLPTFQLEEPAALFSSFILSPNSWWYNKKVEDWGNDKSPVVQFLLLFFLKLIYSMTNRLILLTVYTIRSSKCDCIICLEKYGRLFNHIWEEADGT